MKILRAATLVAIFIKSVTASTDRIPSQDDLVKAASDPELMCSPVDLFNLLGKIEKQKDQEKAIGDGVYKLFERQCIECVILLLDALEGSESFKYLKDVSIKQAFRSGLYHGNKSIVELLYDHPAVTSQDYATGLINSGCRSTQDPMFIFLLGEADQDDLNAVKKHDWYRTRSEEFRKMIENALLTAKPGGTRPDRRNNIQRAKLAIETFENDSSMRIPTVISQLIASYLVEESIPKPITTPVKKTIGNKRTHPDGSANESA